MKAYSRLVVVLAGFIGACSPQQSDPFVRSIDSQQHPIVGGSLDTNPAHAAVAFIEIYDASYQLYAACTGTLISPDVVVTAGHCVSDDGGNFVGDAKRYGVYFDTSNDGSPDWPSTSSWQLPESGKANQNVIAATRMTGFQAWAGNVKNMPVNDIALLKLSSSAPFSIKPIPPLPASLAANLNVGTMVEYVGYGDQDYPTGSKSDCCYSQGPFLPPVCHACPAGTRFHVSVPLSAICTSPNGCDSNGSTPPWTISSQGYKGPCNGDSGGPALTTINGQEYVVGVTSYGDSFCVKDNVSTKVDHFECFLCNDVDSCTTHRCDAVNGCQHTSANEGGSCGDICSGVGVCQNGACVSRVPKNCDDGNPCTTDSCAPSTGCFHTPTNEGGSCGDICSGGVCQNGACVSRVPKNCDDGNPCTTDSCAPSTGCVHTPASEGGSCGDICSGIGVCQSGTCVHGPAPSGVPKNCDDNNPCTADSCDRWAGCLHTPVKNGSPCGDICNEICNSGKCVSGPPIDCDDKDPCTSDSCDSAKGCQHTPRPEIAGCGGALGISPGAATVAPRFYVVFGVKGGSGGLKWLLATNASGGYILNDGLYTSGTKGGVVDIVRVTDSKGSTATARVTVTGTEEKGSGCAVAGAGSTPLVVPGLVALLLRRRRTFAKARSE